MFNYYLFKIRCTRIETGDERDNFLGCFRLRIENLISVKIYSVELLGWPHPKSRVNNFKISLS